MNKIRLEAAWLAATFAVFSVILYIAYQDESIAVVARTAAAVYWLFVIPGYAVMLHWRSHLGFIERIAAGTAGATVVVGVTSYYLGIIGLKLQNQTLILPAAVIIISAFAAKIQAQKERQPPQL